MSDRSPGSRPPTEPESQLTLERYRSALRAAKVGLFDWDLRTNQVYYSPEWKRQIGYDDHEISNDFDEWTSRVHPDDLPNALRAVQAFVAKPWPDYQLEFRFRHKDGSYRWMLMQASSQVDAEGRAIRMLGLHVDITERKHAELALLQSETTERRLAEEALRQRERELRLITNHLPGPISHVSRDLRYLFVNDHYERVFGKSRRDVLGRTMSEVIGDELFQRAEPYVRRVLAGEQVSFENQVRIATGVVDHALVTFAPDLDPEGNVVGFFVIGFDISARKELEEQLRQAQKLEAVGQLAGGVAHDFNNVLTVIQGHTAMLEMDPGLTTIARQSLGEIKQAADRAANLTRQLLTFSRRQARRPSYLDLNGVVANIARLLERVLGEDIALDLHLANQDLIVLADAGMMEQVLLNLAVNSRDAMPRGGRLRIETSAIDFDTAIVGRIPMARPGAFLCLATGDTGMGIPLDVLPRIFEPFFTTKDVGKGTGLGLATVYGIVQQHDGWITVDSELGRGTTFRVYLPRQIGAKVGAPPAREVVLLRGGQETILLVEDEPALRALAANLLERAGYRVLAAANGPQALQLDREHPNEVDLLLTDLVMPGGMSGFDLGALLTAKEPQLRVVYTSGYSPQIGGRGQELVAGVNFLPKPFVSDGLLRIVRAVLDRPRA